MRREVPVMLLQATGAPLVPVTLQLLSVGLQFQPGLTYPVWLRGLFVSFPLLVIKTSPPFPMRSQRLLDPPHRRGDLVSTAWRWIKGGLAMAVRGREGQIGSGGCSRKNQRKEGIQRWCCHCVMVFVAGIFCNLFKWESLFVLRARLSDHV